MGHKNPSQRWFTGFGRSGGGSWSPTQPAAMVITCGKSQQTVVGMAPPGEAEVANTDEILSSTGGEALV